MAAVHRFGVFELDVASEELRRGGLRLHATPQALRLLTLLVERAGTIVTREEIRAALWPDEHFIAYEQAINSLIRQIRTLLGDRAVGSRYLETLPRRGYRFIGRIDANAPLPAAPAPMLRLRTSPLLAFVVLLLLRSSFVPDRDSSPLALTTAPRHRVSVAAFVVDDDPSSKSVALRITERVRRELALLRPIGVSVEPDDASPSRLAVAGRVTRAAGETRLVISLLDAQRREVWTERFTDPRPDEVARATAGAAARSLVPLFTGDTVVEKEWDPETLRLYRLARSRSRHASHSDLEAAERLYEEVLRRAPRFPEAHSGLGSVLMAFAIRGVANPPTIVRARQAFQRAMTLRPTMAEAHLAAGVFALSVEHRTAVAAESTRRAIELEPGFADAYAWHASALSALGEHDAAIDSFRIAQHLEPRYAASTTAGVLCFHARRFEDAAAEYARVLERNPSSLEALWGMAAAHMKMGRDDAAGVFLRRAILADPTASEADRSDADVRRRSIVVVERRVAQRRSSAYRLATLTCLYGGDAERCIAAIDRAVRMRAMGSENARLDPAFDVVRNDARFQSAVAQPPRW